MDTGKVLQRRFVVVPVWGLVASVLVAGVWMVRGSADNAGSVVLVVYMSCLLTLVAVILHSDKPWYVFLVFLMQAVASVVAYAMVYAGVGLIDDTSTIDDASSAFYFSLVTWTTLGYGDLRPPLPIRLIASSQAMLGYIYLGIFVGLLMSRIDRASPRGPKGD
ncbi:MAG: ion channel [Pseudomonadota bacterium]|nr:ion channel [Pseudomonadota bacterium]